MDQPAVGDEREGSNCEAKSGDDMAFRRLLEHVCFDFLMEFGYWGCRLRKSICAHDILIEDILIISFIDDTGASDSFQ